MIVADVWHSQHWIDIRDWAGVAATTVAALLAAYAIWQSKKDARRSAAALVGERMVQFEISILRELADFVWQDETVAYRTQRCRLLLRLSSSELPLTRGRFEDGPSEEDRGVFEHVLRIEMGGPHPGWSVDNLMRERLVDEISEAITRAQIRGGQWPEWAT